MPATAKNATPGAKKTTKPAAKAKSTTVHSRVVKPGKATKATKASAPAPGTVTPVRVHEVPGGAKPIKPATPAPAPAAPKAAKADKAAPVGSRKAVEIAAAAGKLPPAPDFSAATHKRFVPVLDRLVAMVKAKDVAGLKAEKINPVSSSPKALDRYRNLAVIALEAQAAPGEAV